MARVAKPENATSIETKFNLQIAQLRLTLQQVMAKQLTARMSIEAIRDDHRGEERGRDRFQRDQRERSRSRCRKQEHGYSSNNLCWYHLRFDLDVNHFTPHNNSSGSSLMAMSD